MVWYLQSENDDSVSINTKNFTPINYTMYTVLRFGHSITVGRKDCILLLDNDKSISRHHATISWTAENTILLKDSGKYGTFVNGEKLKSGSETGLHENDLIRFGIYQSSFRLKRKIFKLCTSRVSIDTKKQIDRGLRAICGGHGIQWTNTWESDCTHLVLDDRQKILVTEKIALALLHCKHIVNVQFFNDLCARFEGTNDTRQPIPQESEYIPQSNSADWDSILGQSDRALLEIVPNRGHMFANKTLVLFDKNLYDKNKIIIEAGGGELVDASAMEIDQPFFDQYRTAIIINDEFLPIPETKQSRLLELGFELVSNSAILSAILTANVKKYCNPRAPDTDAFNGDTADASLVPTLVIDSLIPDQTDVKLTEDDSHLEQATTTAAAASAAQEDFEQAPTFDKCPNSNIVEGLPTQTQDSQLVPSDHESQQYSQEPDAIILQPIKFQGSTKVKMEQTTEVDTDLSSSQQRRDTLPSENKHTLLSGQAMVEPASVPANSENDNKRFASIMARRRRRDILPSQSQSMDISDDDNDNDNRVEEIPTVQHKDKPSVGKETQPASKDDSEPTHGFVKPTVKQENQEMHLDSESFIDVEYIDVATLQDNTQELAQLDNSPLHHFAIFDSNRSNSGTGTTYNAKRFRKQRIFQSDDPQQVSHDIHNGHCNNSGIIEMHETIEFEETVANADCPNDDFSDESDGDHDNELINITAAVTASSKRRAAVGTKRKRVTRASTRSTRTRSNEEDDHDDDEFEPVSTRSRRRTTRR